MIVAVAPPHSVIYVGHQARDMSSVVLWNKAPGEPGAEKWTLAALYPLHHELLVKNGSREPGRPQHFVRHIGSGSIELDPPADREYWLEITFRNPIKYRTDSGGPDVV